MDTQYREWLVEAKGWIEAAFATFDMFDLVEEVSISFNNRFTRRAGDACYVKREIRLSFPLWPRMSEQERYETAIHEAAHLIAFRLYGQNISAHGYQWKRVMIRCGVKPERCHSIDRTGLRKKRKSTKIYEAYCNCDEPHRITKYRVNQIIRGIPVICTKCNSRLFLSKEKLAACNPK